MQHFPLQASEQLPFQRAARDEQIIVANAIAAVGVHRASVARIASRLPLPGNDRDASTTARALEKAREIIWFCHGTTGSSESVDYKLFAPIGFLPRRDLNAEGDRLHKIFVQCAHKHLFVGSNIRESRPFRISYLPPTGREGFWATTDAGNEWLSAATGAFVLPRVFKNSKLPADSKRASMP
jgi:hypothetical protein